MARKRKITPTDSYHKASRRGRLTWTDSLGIRHEQLLPGPFNSPESLEAKTRLELELVTSPTAVGDGTSLSVVEVLSGRHLSTTASRDRIEASTSLPTTAPAVSRPDIRVVQMSGYNEQEVSNHFAGKGLAGFVQKSFRVDDQNSSHE